jgi:5-methyltetrahydrofolate--homocysteine methyltransferase
MADQLEYKPDFERARRAWDALWNHEIVNRPCTLVTAARGPDAPLCPRLVPVEGDFEQTVRDCDAYLKTHAFLGEAMPAFRRGFGPDQMAAFLGAPLTISQGSNQTSWSEKIVTDWDSFLPLRIEDNNRYFQRMKEFHAVAAAHLEGRCLLCEIDMHSNIDLLEGLRGAQDLLFDLIDHPETVLRAMAETREIFRKVFQEFFQYGSKARWGTTSLLPMYDRRRFNRIQADFIALLNPELFRKIVLPTLVDEAQYLDRSCFHLDGPDALIHLDDLLAVRELDAFQWVSGAGNPRPIEWPEVLHRIQKAGKIIILHLSAGEVKRIHGEYDPALLVYDVKTDSLEEGMELLDWLEDNT